MRKTIIASAICVCLALAGWLYAGPMIGGPFDGGGGGGSSQVVPLGTPTLGSTVGPSSAQAFSVTIANACTIDLSTAHSTWGANGVQSTKTLYITNGAAATITWTGVTWEGTASTSTPPTLAASGINCLLFVTSNGGSTVYGVQVW
jgi:hypothetical protein